jgi:hypothetical protein
MDEKAKNVVLIIIIIIIIIVCITMCLLYNKPKSKTAIVFASLFLITILVLVRIFRFPNKNEDEDEHENKDKVEPDTKASGMVFMRGFDSEMKSGDMGWGIKTWYQVKFQDKHFPASVGKLSKVIGPAQSNKDTNPIIELKSIEKDVVPIFYRWQPLSPNLSTNKPESNADGWEVVELQPYADSNTKFVDKLNPASQFVKALNSIEGFDCQNKIDMLQCIFNGKSDRTYKDHLIDLEPIDDETPKSVKFYQRIFKKFKDLGCNCEGILPDAPEFIGWAETNSCLENDCKPSNLDIYYWTDLTDYRDGNSNHKSATTKVSANTTKNVAQFRWKSHPLYAVSLYRSTSKDLTERVEQVATNQVGEVPKIHMIDTNGYYTTESPIFDNITFRNGDTFKLDQMPDTDVSKSPADNWLFSVHYKFRYKDSEWQESTSTSEWSEPIQIKPHTSSQPKYIFQEPKSKGILLQAKLVQVGMETKLFESQEILDISSTTSFQVPNPIEYLINLFSKSRFLVGCENNAAMIKALIIQKFISQKKNVDFNDIKKEYDNWTGQSYQKEIKSLGGLGEDYKCKVRMPSSGVNAYSFGSHDSNTKCGSNGDSVCRPWKKPTYYGISYFDSNNQTPGPINIHNTKIVNEESTNPEISFQYNQRENEEFQISLWRSTDNNFKNPENIQNIQGTVGVRTFIDRKNPYEGPETPDVPSFSWSQSI